MATKTKPKSASEVWQLRVREFLHAEMFTHHEQEACLKFVEFLRDGFPECADATRAIKVYFRMSMFFADIETKKEHAIMLEAFSAFANEIVDGSRHETLDEQ